MEKLIQKLGLKIEGSNIDFSKIDLGDPEALNFTKFGTSGYRIQAVKIDKEIEFDTFAVLEELSYVVACCEITLQYCNENNAPKGIFVCGDGLRPQQQDFLDIYAAIVSAHGLIPYQDSDESITSVGAAHDALSFEEITTVIYRSCSHNPPVYLGAKMYLNNDPSPILGEIGNQLFEKMKDIVLNKKKIKIDPKYMDKINYIDAIEYHVNQTLRMNKIAMEDFEESIPKNENYLIALNGGHKQEINKFLTKYGIAKENIHFIEERKLILKSDPTSKNPEKARKYLKACEKYNAKFLIATDSDQDRPILWVKNEDKLIQITPNEILNLAMIEIGENNNNLIPIHTHPTLGAYKSKIENDPLLSGVGYLFISILFKRLLSITCDKSRKEEAIILDKEFKQLRFDDIQQMKENQFAISIEESGGAQLVSKQLDFNSFDKNGLFTMSMILYALSKHGIENILDAAYQLPLFSDRDSVELENTAQGKQIVQKMSEMDNFMDFKVSAIYNRSKKPICIVLRNNEMTVQIRASGTEPILRIYYMAERELVQKNLKSKEVPKQLKKLLEEL